ncbi:MAG: hypothetical protein AAFR62_20790, partial [Cyanobacteria bacterium J06629_2]
VKLDARVNGREMMKERANLLESKAMQTQTLTRSRYHYRPISPPEFILTLVLTVFIGMGIFFASMVNTEQNNTGSQIQPITEKADYQYK